MPEERLKRKLSAIFSADVEGYSRLMGDDEASTVRTLESYRKAMADLIDQFRGRVVDSPGDNLLAEFGSVVDAVQCAVEIQEVLKAKNEELAEDRKMMFRIGVNLGDVIEEGDRIYGDGVNIAARVEGLAEAGGISVSGTVYDHIMNKLALGYEYLGEHAVKNIKAPVRVYRIPTGIATEAPSVSQEKGAKSKRWQWAALVALVALILVFGAVAIWNFYLRRPSLEAADPEKMAYPLPDKPSIAVLPFTNMSDDPKQEYFNDGITENIITGLSRIPNLFVIARNSTFTYKGKPVKVQQVAEELGVRYVLEGSVQRSGDRLRITAQLIDAIKGHHLWSERYDRLLKDIFDLQDDITMKIITELQVKLTQGEEVRSWAKGTDNIEAYLKFLQGLEHYYKFNKEGNVMARQIFEEAIALDQRFAVAYSRLARVHFMDLMLGVSNNPKQSMAKISELAQKSLALDRTSAEAYLLLGSVYLQRRQHEKAIAETEKAIALAPNSAETHFYLGLTLHFAGRYEESIAFLNKAIRLDPLPPTYYLTILGNAYQLSGRLKESMEIYKKAIYQNSDNLFAHMRLGATYSLIGREEEARTEVSEVLRIDPKFSLENFAKTVAYKKKADLELVINALRKAGLPYKPPQVVPDNPS